MMAIFSRGARSTSCSSHRKGSLLLGIVFLLASIHPTQVSGHAIEEHTFDEIDAAFCQQHNITESPSTLQRRIVQTLQDEVTELKTISGSQIEALTRYEEEGTQDKTDDREKYVTFRKQRREEFLGLVAGKLDFWVVVYGAKGDGEALLAYVFLPEGKQNLLKEAITYVRENRTMWPYFSPQEIPKALKFNIKPRTLSPLRLLLSLGLIEIEKEHAKQNGTLSSNRDVLQATEESLRAYLSKQEIELEESTLPARCSLLKITYQEYQNPSKQKPTKVLLGSGGDAPRLGYYTFNNDEIEDAIAAFCKDLDIGYGDVNSYINLPSPKSSSKANPYIPTPRSTKEDIEKWINERGKNLFIIGCKRKDGKTVFGHIVNHPKYRRCIKKAINHVKEQKQWNIFDDCLRYWNLKNGRKSGPFMYKSTFSWYLFSFVSALQEFEYRWKTPACTLPDKVIARLSDWIVNDIPERAKNKNPERARQQNQSPVVKLAILEVVGQQYDNFLAKLKPSPKAPTTGLKTEEKENSDEEEDYEEEEVSVYSFDKPLPERHFAPAEIAKIERYVAQLLINLERRSLFPSANKGKRGQPSFAAFKFNQQNLWVLICKKKKEKEIVCARIYAPSDDNEKVAALKKAVQYIVRKGLWQLFNPVQRKLKGKTRTLYPLQGFISSWLRHFNSDRNPPKKALTAFKKAFFQKWHLDDMVEGTPTLSLSLLKVTYPAFKHYFSLYAFEEKGDLCQEQRLDKKALDAHLALIEEELHFCLEIADGETFADEDLKAHKERAEEVKKGEETLFIIAYKGDNGTGKFASFACSPIEEELLYTIISHIKTRKLWTLFGDKHPYILQTFVHEYIEQAIEGADLDAFVSAFAKKEKLSGSIPGSLSLLKIKYSDICPAVATIYVNSKRLSTDATIALIFYLILRWGILYLIEEGLPTSFSLCSAFFLSMGTTPLTWLTLGMIAGMAANPEKQSHHLTSRYATIAIYLLTLALCTWFCDLFLHLIGFPSLPLRLERWIPQLALFGGLYIGAWAHFQATIIAIFKQTDTFLLKLAKNPTEKSLRYAPFIAYAATFLFLTTTYFAMPSLKESWERSSWALLLLRASGYLSFPAIYCYITLSREEEILFSLFVIVYICQLSYPYLHRFVAHFLTSHKALLWPMWGVFYLPLLYIIWGTLTYLADKAGDDENPKTIAKAILGSEKVIAPIYAVLTIGDLWGWWMGWQEAPTTNMASTRRKASMLRSDNGEKLMKPFDFDMSTSTNSAKESLEKTPPLADWEEANLIEKSTTLTSEGRGGSSSLYGMGLLLAMLAALLAFYLRNKKSKE